MSESQHERMILAFFDGRLAQAKIDELAEELVRSEATRELFWSLAKVHVGVEAHLQSARGEEALMQSEHDVEAVYGALLEYEQRAAAMSVPREMPEDFERSDDQVEDRGASEFSGSNLPSAHDRRPQRVLEAGPLVITRRPSTGKRRQLGKMLALAAGFAILVSVGALLMQKPPQSEPPIVQGPTYLATMGESIGATWLSETGESITLQPGDRLESGLWQLASGVAELEMANQSRVVLEGPASLNLERDDQLTLDAGRVVAHVGQQAHSFTVSTPRVNVTDLGTEFGVDVHRDGTTDVAVFEGEAYLAYPDPPNGESSQRVILTSGWSASVNPDGRLPEQVNQLGSQSVVFIRQMLDHEQLGTGIVATHGHTQKLEVPESGRVALSDLIHRQQTFIHRESRRVLQDDLPVAINSDGQIEDHEHEPYVIPAGTAVTSYILHFAPGLEASDLPINSAGAIRFAGRVAGVIANSQRLEQTDETFAAEQLVYEDLDDESRGLENDDIQPLPDTVTLTHEGRLLQFDFWASSGVDQIRVLVVDEWPQETTGSER